MFAPMQKTRGWKKGSGKQKKCVKDEIDNTQQKFRVIFLLQKKMLLDGSLFCDFIDERQEEAVLQHLDSIKLENPEELRMKAGPKNIIFFLIPLYFFCFPLERDACIPFFSPRPPATSDLHLYLSELKFPNVKEFQFFFSRGISPRYNRRQGCCRVFNQAASDLYQWWDWEYGKWWTGREREREWIRPGECFNFFFLIGGVSRVGDNFSGTEIPSDVIFVTNGDGVRQKYEKKNTPIC